MRLRFMPSLRLPLPARVVRIFLGVLLATWIADPLAHAATRPSAASIPYLRAPSVDTYATHDPAGRTILSNGRYLQPLGKHYPVASFPYGLAISRDGHSLFVISEGAGRLVTAWDGPNPQFRDLNPPQSPNGRVLSNGGGAAFSPDGKTVYWSSGETGLIYVFDAATGHRRADISLNVAVGDVTFADSYAVDLQLSADGRHLYCADVTNFRVAIVDTQLGQVVGSVRVGRYPYALTVLGSRVFVANIGLFEYSPIPPPSEPGFDPRGITRPAFGFPSKEAEEGVRFEGRQIPGLGKPNVPESFSVWSVDVQDPVHPRVLTKLKTGLLLGAPSDNGKTVGGSAPNFLVGQGEALFVSNGNNDLIERLDLAKNEISLRQRLAPSPLVAGLRGVSPAGMVLSPDGSRLYVAELGINAIAVLDPRTLQILGHLPTAWYPYRLAISPDGTKLACICFRGFGNGPNAGTNIPSSAFLGLKGSLTILDVPADAALPKHTADVLAYNGIVDRHEERPAPGTSVIPALPGEISRQIKHVVFIAKENHTFDAIFDRVPGAKHDPTLLRWGLHQTLRQEGQPTLENVGVMVNHNALARQFTVSDNFYMEPEASGVGHRWLVGVQPNNLMQMTYTVGWSFKKNSTAPGRRYSMGSNGSLIPEDYPEAGSMWEHLARHRIRFRNYGEGFEFPGVEEDEDESPTGAREVVNTPMSKVLFDNTCFGFPIFNMNIPDQYRAYWFEKDVRSRFLGSWWRRFPSFVNIALCSDHGTSPKPERGYPYLASWMADNDLALGRIVEFLSHTPYWKNMAIFVTQDDSGGEPDHVDAQRSVLLVISPWAKRANVSHRHTTIVSMHRTLYQTFGLPPLNLFDALANDFSDCFTNTPDFTPYRCEPIDPRVFDPEKAKDPKDPDYGQARLQRSIPMDDDDEMQRVLRRAEKETQAR